MARVRRSRKPPSQAAALRDALLRWFDRERRSLPFRDTKDPYAIWLSEVMLQQTQVQTVIPYWERFRKRFPTVEQLASADEAQVLSLWSGLGYYSRARNLHKAAKAIAARGSFPRTAGELLELPGFGPYTSGAVASIAFGEEAPIVDGNVARVFSRLFCIEGAPGDRQREQALWARASELVRGERPGDWNQALMELGATVCRPENPLCLLCPVKASCRALAEGRVHELPPPKKRAPRKLLNLAVAVHRRGGELWMVKNDARGLFGGLWQLPVIEYPARDRELPRAFGERLGAAASVKRALGVVRRTLTHRDLELHLFELDVSGAPSEGRFVSREQLAELGISKAMSEAARLAFEAVRRERNRPNPR